MAHITKDSNLPVGQVKIGDTLANIDRRDYGLGFSHNRVITDIRTTKSGRIELTTTFDYLNVSGELKKGCITKSGVLSPKTKVWH